MDWVIYKGLLISKDIAGDGYNIYLEGQLFDEGYASVQKAKEAIDKISIDE